MIEFKDHRVRLAAVNARVLTEEPKQLPPVVEQPYLYLRDSASDVVRFVRDVVGPAKGRVTDPAMALKGTDTLIRVGEIFQGLALATAPALLERSRLSDS